MNVGQADPFGPVRVVVPADKGEHAAAENYAVGNIDETDNRSRFEREAGPAIPFDGLTDHHDHGTVVGGLGDRHDLRGGRVLRGWSGGGFLRGFFRLNLTFGAENRGHRIAIRNDIFAAFVAEQLCPAGFAVPLKRHGFVGALHDLDGENAVVVTGAGIEIFLADFKLFHFDYLHILNEMLKLLCTVSAPFSCRPVRLAVAELYAPATGRLVFPSF